MYMIKLCDPQSGKKLIHFWADGDNWGCFNVADKTAKGYTQYTPSVDTDVHMLELEAPNPREKVALIMLPAGQISGKQVKQFFSKQGGVRLLARPAPPAPAPTSSTDAPDEED
eukprot:TRINITY_DN61782_c0_g1_i1.p2 TRINITY_DN61782_c0_g1~~TRINITY_DN61782_c0_g1_i1.p2  ORF type:complete len:113 (+),score=32.54 TRINITY_DN61782_c0_g1_i1:440-778(+)